MTEIKLKHLEQMLETAQKRGQSICAAYNRFVKHCPDVVNESAVVYAAFVRNYHG